MTPLFDKVLIQIQNTETITSSGIILSQEAEKLEKATILKMGPDCVSNLKENDIINLFFDKKKVVQTLDFAKNKFFKTV